MINKRSLLILPVPASTTVHIKWEGGGEVPAQLQGQYTSRKAALDAIAVWRSQNPEERDEVKIDQPRDEPLPRRASKPRPATPLG